MRNNIIHIGADELKYEIRGIINIAEKLQSIGKKIVWENIGDPIVKGHKIPKWMQNIIQEASKQSKNYAYCPTKGLTYTREFLADLNNKKNGVQITAEDIIFFNGLGDAISTMYHYLRRESRVLGPSPAYSTHSSAEAAHAGAPHLTYNLDPNNDWLPDINDIYNKVKYNPQIAGILLINPDNPTGTVYSQEILKQIIKIAQEFDLFIIADEIYNAITFNDTNYSSLSEILNNVPGIAMKGISKEFPWPGSRCGWIEAYNTDKDPIFKKYIKSLSDAKMLEVCSTTLPQAVIPDIMSHPKYQEYLQIRNLFFQKRSNEAFETFRNIDGIIVNKTNGAFYFTINFAKNILNHHQILAISVKEQNILTHELISASLDKRFVLYLMAKTGICTVPLSGFNCSLDGFRITLLEIDDQKFSWICKEIKNSIIEYLKK